MKKTKQFAVLAEYYDRFNGADYGAYADYTERVLKTYGSGSESLILDLACGTGRLTEALAERGYDMIGADISEEMLSVAASSAREKGLDILYLNQDMRSFELYGTVSAAVCTLDGISYLTDKRDAEKCFKLISNYLDPGALFLFDINSVYRFKEVLSKRDFFLSEDGVYLGWRSELDEKRGICELLLTFFIENASGGYTKKEETQSERVWELDELSDTLKKCGLTVIDVFGGLDMHKANDTDEKWYFVCRGPLDKTPK